MAGRARAGAGGPARPAWSLGKGCFARDRLALVRALARLPFLALRRLRWWRGSWSKDSDRSYHERLYEAQDYDPFDPGYPGYRHFVRAFEGVAKVLPVSAQTDFQPTLAMVRAAWGARTKALLLGSPSNPTGTLISPRELEELAVFIAERGGVLLVDEIYQGLVYGMEPRTAYGLPGEVVGPSGPQAPLPQRE